MKPIKWVVNMRHIVFAAIGFFSLLSLLLGGACRPSSPNGTSPAHAAGADAESTPRPRPTKPQLPPAGRRPLEPGFAPRPLPENPRTLADLLSPENSEEPETAPAEPFPATNPEGPSSGAETPRIEEALARNLGIRKLVGRHVTLYTDLPPSPEVEQLPQLFDAAVPLWCRYFQLDPPRAAEWRISASLIREKSRFANTDLLPGDLPPFLHGYQRGRQVWLYDQPTDYYRRHLLLHEGTHAFMTNLLGGAGPPWYMEGIAERLATHRWNSGALELGVNPAQSEGFDHWGRIKILRDEVAANRGRLLEQVMGYGPTAHRELAPYAWCWGAVLFLETHPLTKTAFAELQARVADTGPGFQVEFLEALRPHWGRIREDWQLFVMDVEYGYDVSRNAVAHAEPRPLPPAGATITLQADRGWQSTGVALEAGVHYEIEADGRFVIHADPRPWIAEPNGVTLRYYGGRPLGMLLGAIRPVEDSAAGGLTPLAKPAVIGSGRTITPATAGTLYLKLNDSPAELAENEGTVTVRIVAAE